PGVAGDAARARQRDQVLDGDLLQDLLLEREAGAALVRERGERDLPALVHRADHVRGRDADALQEDLAELRRAGQLAERTDRDPRAGHVEDEVGEPAVLRQRRVGTREEDAPARELRVARPHLLPADDEAVAVGLGAGAERGQVAAGVRLAEELAPELLGGQRRSIIWDARGARRAVRCEPGAEARAEGLVLNGEGEVHGRRSTIDAGCEVERAGAVRTPDARRDAPPAPRGGVGGGRGTG